MGQYQGRQHLQSYCPITHGLHCITIIMIYSRRMTGVGGRPEVILEGADSVGGPWSQYEFLYKPGNTSSAPQFMLPHQPRLDWQMWFAALGSYQHNPWLLSLVFRLLGESLHSYK